MSNHVKNPEFKQIDDFSLNFPEATLFVEVFKNIDGQFITVMANFETGERNVNFYSDFETIAAVYSDDLKEETIHAWQ